MRKRYLVGVLHGVLLALAAYLLSQLYADHVLLYRIAEFLSRVQG